MKKILVSLLVLVSGAVSANPQQELVQRLDKTDGFTAQFSQTVVSPDDEVVMEGTGSVEIARPSLFRWTTNTPDENVLVSDGETLWYYSPFIEQVSIYWQEQATEQTPFVLLTRNKASDWDKYNVIQNGDRFTLTPMDETSTQGQFQIDIDKAGAISGFNVVEQDGQRSKFTFNDYRAQTPAKSRFVFEIPNGVEVDDQRN
ncbi:outer membrane lipoprotein carrier protein LolA [Vibrio breoganii]|uniref:Outer-membrane lipoprotein carrier protein n=1 Tax=Vibrio breoganii TaxID=553239 RepID=A0AAN0XV15_9VIBR|nr:outer membrane lipoprotein chaperone LolA [Vibrio breoganii]ANO33203.1 outer membrane lipoprotein carrier protein LolA [Vibrio breoganii]OCH75941.1 outer membrane lipoprotein carrier protein LolA [Vibrio breoganii]OED90148.1 outer membrane lipoprotein carrier protein LolA [Vibrio breoganii ZF-55]PMG86363.1 outer membrane lipoprotein carrier protein LolA [Vibrio breoganii]PMG96603.1 outer membrane lipoprotein carrier protein LolA [Vibrio breoganii]